MGQDSVLETCGISFDARNLPALPQVLGEVSALLEREDASLDRIAKVISRDQVLSAKVLKMVNSPIYGFSGRIGSVQHALVLLGGNVIKGIVISSSVFDMMASSMAGLWEHSLGCAMACTALAHKAGLKDPEEYSIAGLLHDLGKVVTAFQFPDVHRQICDLAAEEDITFLDAEERVLGFGHDRISAWVADSWHLPLFLKEGMAMHHKPYAAVSHPGVAAVVHIGDFLVRVLEFGDAGDDHAPYLRPEALKILKLTVRDLEEVLDAMTQELGAGENLDFS